MIVSRTKKGEDVLLNKTVNTKHDTGSYDCSGSQREILYDGNVLYEAFLKSRENSDWKESVQKFESTYLLKLAEIQKQLKEETYEFKKGNSFILNERGKTRKITGQHISDRIVGHVLCDNIINPAINKYLIHDNGASQVGKGISFTRRRLEQHLHQFYRRNGSNDGYILLIDFSKYYDNLRHDVIIDMLSKYIQDPFIIRLVQNNLESEKIDVSYMADDEYRNCMNATFDSLEYENIPTEKLTGKKYMRKHVNIGNQISQSIGISYRIPFDNYIKIVKGITEYGAYMDDCYVIHESKEFLEKLLKESIKIAEDIGITVNVRKTRICKLSSMWRFLQIQYSLTNTGRVIRKINPKRLTAMRRKMKKLCPFMDYKGFEDFYKSWFRSHFRYMSKKQRENMDNLFNELQYNKFRADSLPP